MKVLQRLPKGSLKWAIWLFAIALTFTALEWWSLHNNTTTLSRFVWNVSEAFRPFEFIAGFLTGFLACHFWWGGIVGFAKPDIKEE